MKSFFKENFVLISGLALPLVLTLVFIGATHLKTPLKDPPKTPVIYAINYYEAIYDIHVTKDGKLELVYTPPDTSRGEYCCPNPPTLYVYTPSTQKEDKIPLPEFEKDKKFKGIIPHPNKLSAETTSPDGWRFEYDYNYNEGNLITIMFGGGSRYGAQNVLKKDTFRVPVSPRKYESGRFIGWSLPETK